MIIRNLYLYFVFCVVIAMAVSSCGHDDDPRLLRLERMAGNNYDSAAIALDSLQAIDISGLSTDNRFYRSFLTVKLSDKAYIDHTSDSIIISVIDYAKDHFSKERYAESLYYGGRVYSDLGDYPQALQYFQQALDELPENTNNIRLKSRILSQTGRLLNNLRLYDEAIPYLKNSLICNRLLNDTLNEVYDLQLLGAIYLHSKNYLKSDSCFILAIKNSTKLYPEIISKSKMYRALIKHRTGQLDSALCLITNIPSKVELVTRNTALSTAAIIYLKAGIYDSAYTYAYQLLKNDDALNKKIAYEILLSSEIRNRINPDTILQYAIDYHKIIENYFDENKNRLVLQQQTKYNYDFHDRNRLKAENQNKYLWIFIYIISFALFISIISILISKNRGQKKIILLHKAIENVNAKETEAGLQNSDCKKIVSKPESLLDNVEDAQSLRQLLRTKYIKLSKSFNYKKEIDSRILQSTAYQDVVEHISNANYIKENSTLWQDLENIVLASSPNLKNTLNILAGNKLSVSDFHTVLLIKCGITPSQMAVLLNRAKGTIVSRRESLSIKLLGEKISTKDIDEVIRAL